MITIPGRNIRNTKLYYRNSAGSPMITMSKTLSPRAVTTMAILASYSGVT